SAPPESIFFQAKPSVFADQPAALPFAALSERKLSANPLRDLQQRLHASAAEVLKAETGDSRGRSSRRQCSRPPCSDAAPSVRAGACRRRRERWPALASSLPLSREQLFGHEAC